MRAGWSADDQRTTLVILVDGTFRVDLTECSVTLAVQGDYLMWGPGIDHSWEALAPSVVVTVRWPSQPS
jgi:quercetin dioxygenase-like cupin family protein